MQLDIRPGVAESLPFEDESVDFVNAYSVLEHVDDPDQSHARGLPRPAAPGRLPLLDRERLSPFQVEIAGFPLFPWYPPPLQRRIMSWATEKRPALVGNTTRPAIHWFKHRDVRRSAARGRLRRGRRPLAAAPAASATARSAG